MSEHHNKLPEPLAELAWRELLSQRTDGLADAFRAGPVTAYCGFDPTADSLHVGNLVPIMGLVHLQRAGHRPIALVGGGTGMIGDPSGRSSERTLLDIPTIEANVRGIHAQLEKFLNFEGPNAATMANNVDWLGKLSLLEFLRDTGKHFTVNYMLAKDSVKARMEDGISFTELSYMLLQAHDFLELHKREGVTLQIGGSDQWGNITAGMELIRRSIGGSAHAMTLPLVTNASGAKFGKSEGGAIWLDAKRTSPYKFYQYWIGSDDRDVSKYLRYFTLLSMEEVMALDIAVRERPEKREAQRALANDVTTRVHGADAARVAAEVSMLLFGKGDAAGLSEAALSALREEIPYITHVENAENGNALDVLDWVVALGFAASRGAGKRLLSQGGLTVNGVKLSEAAAGVPRDALLRGKYALIKKGARDYGLVEVPG
ncbi:MAG: tyrosine--tRNA ligase [Gemmatimonadaceae bacterium]